MKKLFTCQYGSRLYGTETPESDTDLKHIVLPSIDNLLLGKTVKNTVNKTNRDHAVRNSAEDVDEEFIPIQVFAKDFLEGQTYALELAFAIDGTEAGQTFYYDGHPVATGDVRGKGRFYRFCGELRHNFLTSNMHAMTRYAINQANLYSDKGERLNAARALLKVLLYFPFATRLDDALKYRHQLSQLEQVALLFPEHVQITEYDRSGKGNMEPCIKLLGRVIPFHCTVFTACQTVEGLINKYGDRAKAASKDNVDWKAMMHALRIIDEGICLLVEKRLVFPGDYEYRQHLKAIKAGQVPFDIVSNQIAAKMLVLQELEKNSDLPELTQELRQVHETWLVGWLRDFYL